MARTTAVPSAPYVAAALGPPVWRLVAPLLFACWLVAACRSEPDLHLTRSDSLSTSQAETPAEPDPEAVRAYHRELLAEASKVGEWGPHFAAPLLSREYVREYHGVPVDVNDVRGDVILLYFWGLDCAPCLARLGAMAGLARDYAPRGVAVYGVLKHDAGLDHALDLLESQGAEPFPSFVDEYGRIARLYGTRGLPWIYLLDPGRRIVGRCVGCGGEDWGDAGLRARFDSLLEATVGCLGG